MLTIENAQVFGFQAAIRGMRNPKNSWAKSDSYPCAILGELTDKNRLYRCSGCKNEFAGRPNCTVVGENDRKLAATLANSGPDDGKFLRMVHVQLDVTAPLYWWKEADQYKVGTVTDSCSTMHKIHARKFDVNDFSHEHVEELTGDDYNMAYDFLLRTVDILNYYRKKFLETGDKVYWWQLIQLLPSSFNQRRTWDLNYAVLRNIYHARRNHKLDEWHTLCNWIETLPYAEELICG